MDLPLSSNYADVEVFHWVLDFACDLSHKHFDATIFLLCDSKVQKNSSKITDLDNKISDSQVQAASNVPCTDGSFVGSGCRGERKSTLPFVLDSYALKIKACYVCHLDTQDVSFQDFNTTIESAESSLHAMLDNVSIQIPSLCMEKYLSIYRNVQKMTVGSPVEFTVEEHCVRIHVSNMDEHRFFAVKIVYETEPEGPSLTWVQDQDSRPCVYTSGHQLNNRSLLPYQDLPHAMSTWHCFLSVTIDGGHVLDQSEITVLMTGEAEPTVTNSEDGSRVLGYKSSYPMPVSTFALAVGTWHLYQTLANQCSNLGVCYSSNNCNTTSSVTGSSNSNFREKTTNRSDNNDSSNNNDTRSDDNNIISNSNLKSNININKAIGSALRHDEPKLRIFSPHSLQGAQLQVLAEHVSACVKALQSILGPYPLSRLDVLVVPAGFDSLGMMCPHLMFLSQSVLQFGDRASSTGMLYHVAHELCHTWLGVLTGPSDWTEEWLTEGICCYLEDVVHAAACQWSKSEAKERYEIRSFLKYRRLKAELDTTPEDLQTLRPNGDSSCPEGETTQPHVIKNGLNSEKMLLQVHYLKGFFLLKHLANVTSQDAFLDTLRKFILTNMGRLFSSQDLLSYCFAKLPKLSEAGLTPAKITQDWLDSPGIPEALEVFHVDNGNSLYKAVSVEVSALKVAANRKRAKKVRGPGTSTASLMEEQAPCTPDALNKRLCPEQSVLLLDWLLQDDVKLTWSQMTQLRERLRVEDNGAEVQHYWCELVIRRRALRYTADLEKFLTRHQAMGVYLYGEMMISENSRLQTLARRLYQRLQPGMSQGQRQAVDQMLHPA